MAKAELAELMTKVLLILNEAQCTGDIGKPVLPSSWDHLIE